MLQVCHRRIRNEERADITGPGERCSSQFEWCSRRQRHDKSQRCAQWFDFESLFPISNQLHGDLCVAVSFDCPHRYRDQWYIHCQHHHRRPFRSRIQPRQPASHVVPSDRPERRASSSCDDPGAIQQRRKLHFDFLRLGDEQRGRCIWEHELRLLRLVSVSGRCNLLLPVVSGCHCCHCYGWVLVDAENRQPSTPPVWARQGRLQSEHGLLRLENDAIVFCSNFRSCESYASQCCHFSAGFHRRL